MYQFLPWAPSEVKAGHAYILLVYLPERIFNGKLVRHEQSSLQRLTVNKRKIKLYHIVGRNLKSLISNCWIEPLKEVTIIVIESKMVLCYMEFTSGFYSETIMYRL